MKTAEHRARIAAGVRNSAKNNPRILARAAGEKHYVPKIPCKFGHRLRYVSSAYCVACGLEDSRRPENRVKNVLRNVRTRAKQEGILFDLTTDYIESIWPTDNLCPVMRTPLVEPSGPSRKGPRSFSPSLDRIEPKSGYVEGNVAVISHYANVLKNNCTDPAVFRRLADWLENKQVIYRTKLPQVNY
jgi:hypothetical protein